MKKFLLLSLVIVSLAGCNWFSDESSDGVTDETSMFVDNGEIAVWYTNTDYDISLRLPDAMEGYESEVVELDGSNQFGTVKRVEFISEGEVVAVLNVHERDLVQANLSNLPHVSRSEDSEFLFSFGNLLNEESDLQSELMDRAFDLGGYLTFE